jgi:hypothetical protein
MNVKPKSVIDRLLGLNGSPDGLGNSHSFPTEQTTGPGSGLEWLPPRGTGAMDAEAASVALVVTGIVVSAACGAVVGAALAPDKSKRTSYAVAGGVLTGIFGPLGSAAQAIYVMVR